MTIACQVWFVSPWSLHSHAHLILELHHHQRYLSQHLPPEYIDSPMLLLDGWDTVVDQMAKLWRDPAALLDRQQKLLAWYDAYMRSKVNELEHALEARESEPTVFCKQPSKGR